PRSARSQGRLAACPSACAISSRTASSIEARRATSTTAAPACASASAIVLPMPELAPVTTATRPDRSNRSTADAGISSFDLRAALEALVRKIFGQAIVGGACMRLHAFETRDACGDLSDVAIGLPRHPLPGDGLQEFVHREAARISGRALGRQDVVG